MKDTELIQCGLDFLNKWPDDKRLPMIVDNDDWNDLGDAVKGLALCLERIANLTITPSSMNAIRIFSEALYAAGYKRGKSSTRLIFRTQEEE